MLKHVFKLIVSDYQRYYAHRGGVIRVLIYALFSRNHCFRYTFWLRLASKPNLFRPLALLMHQHYTIKYGIQIPAKTQIGYGFYIGHGVGIVINGGTRIGNNVNISQFLSIGTNHNTPATIDDEVYIGPHVSIVEDVHIGRGATIGAGSVVVKDIPAHCTAVGVPARVIKENTPSRYITRRWEVDDTQ